MGNQLIMSDFLQSAPETVATFEKHFLDASHRSVGWDIPNLDPLKVRGVAELCCALEGFETMTLQGSLRDAVMPDGMLVRALDGIDDWTKAEALQAKLGLEDGRDPKTYGHYLAGRNVGWRDQITRGIGQWFGAFEGSQIVAQLGKFHDDNIALYQSVETRATHRRRGICSALLRHAALWGLGRAENAVVFIVAEADTDEGRLLPTLKRSTA